MKTDARIMASVAGQSAQADGYKFALSPSPGWRSFGPPAWFFSVE